MPLALLVLLLLPGINSYVHLPGALRYIIREAKASRYLAVSWMSLREVRTDGDTDGANGGVKKKKGLLGDLLRKKKLAVVRKKRGIQAKETVETVTATALLVDVEPDRDTSAPDMDAYSASAAVAEKSMAAQDLDELEMLMEEGSQYVSVATAPSTASPQNNVSYSPHPTPPFSVCSSSPRTS